MSGKRSRLRGHIFLGPGRTHSCRRLRGAGTRNRFFEPCLKHGYSIAPLTGTFIGEFRPTDEPGTITEKDTIEVRSGDIAGAMVIETGTPVDLDSPPALATLFRERAVVEALWHKGLSVQFHPSSFLGPNKRIAEYRLMNGRGMTDGGVMALLTPGIQPTKSRVRRLLQPIQQSEVVVAFPVTSEHVLAVRFEALGGLLREVKRRAFRIAQPVQRVPATSRPTGRAI